jgi:hypothetical protein
MLQPEWGTLHQLGRAHQQPMNQGKVSAKKTEENMIWFRKKGE